MLYPVYTFVFQHSIYRLYTRFLIRRLFNLLPHSLELTPSLPLAIVGHIGVISCSVRLSAMTALESGKREGKTYALRPLLTLPSCRSCPPAVELSIWFSSSWACCLACWETWGFFIALFIPDISHLVVIEENRK